MLERIIIPMILLCFAQFAIADIATDIASGVKVQPTTQNAKNDEVVQENAVEELILAGIPCVIAVQSVRDVYDLTPLETNVIITIALNVEPTCEESATMDEENDSTECLNVARICPTLPLLALYSTGATTLAGSNGLGDTGSSGGGPCAGNSRCSVSPN